MNLLSNYVPKVTDLIVSYGRNRVCMRAIRTSVTMLVEIKCCSQYEKLSTRLHLLLVCSWSRISLFNLLFTHFLALILIPQLHPYHGHPSRSDREPDANALGCNLGFHCNIYQLGFLQIFYSALHHQGRRQG